MVCQVSHATCQVSGVKCCLVNNSMPQTEKVQSYSHIIERNSVLVELNYNTLNGIQTPTPNKHPRINRAPSFCLINFLQIVTCYMHCF